MNMSKVFQGTHKECKLQWKRGGFEYSLEVQGDESKFIKWRGEGDSH